MEAGTTVYSLAEVEEDWVNHGWIFTQQACLHGLIHALTVFNFTVTLLATTNSLNKHIGVLLASATFYFGVLVYIISHEKGVSTGKKALVQFSLIAVAVGGAAAASSTNATLSLVLESLNGVVTGIATGATFHDLEADYWSYGKGHTQLVAFAACELGFLGVPMLCLASLRILDWRVWQFCSSGMAALILVVVALLMLDSPRILLLQGKDDEAIGALAEFAKRTGNSLPDGLILKPEVRCSNPVP